MIPTTHSLEAAESERDESYGDLGVEADEEKPYYEYEWFGLKYSYSYFGYWSRILIASLGLALVMAYLVAEGEGGLALLMAFLFIGGIGLSIFSLVSYRKE